MIGTLEFSRQVGALPVRRGPDGALLVMLVTTLQTQRWIIPKGWPWPNEHDYLAAAAEARRPMEGFVAAHLAFVTVGRDYEVAERKWVEKLSGRYAQDFGPLARKYGIIGTPARA